MRALRAQLPYNYVRLYFIGHAIKIMGGSIDGWRRGSRCRWWMVSVDCVCVCVCVSSRGMDVENTNALVAFNYHSSGDENRTNLVLGLKFA